MDQKNLFLPEYYENREISWLKFNERILKEAQDQENPLWERLKFLSITASNLDEFFMIRVASLKDMVHGGYGKRDIAGMTAREQLEKINQCTHEMAANQYLTYREVLLPLLEKQGLKVIKSHEELTEEQKDFVDQYFREKIYPVLTPMAVDSSRPFPLLRSQSLNLGAIVVKKEAREKELEFATVQVPSVLSRIVLLPKKDSSSQEIILLEQIMERNIQQLFFSYHVICSYPYRITRNADMTIEEDEADDLLKEIQKQVKKRQWGEAVRLEVEEGIEETLLNILKKELYMKEEEIFRISGPLDLTFLMKMYEMEGYDHLKSDPFLPVPMEKLQREDGDIFGEIAKGDILLHHPYMSFEPVVLLIKRAAADPKVLAIKQTLYRVSGHSPIILHWHKQQKMENRYRCWWN